MQAALCNTRVFTARTQSRSASRRSVRVQAADRTLWLPGKGQPGSLGATTPPCPPQLASSSARAGSRLGTLDARCQAHPQRRWAASRPAELQRPLPAPAHPHRTSACPAPPAAGIQAPKHLDGKLAGGEQPAHEGGGLMQRPAAYSWPRMHLSDCCLCRCPICTSCRTCALSLPADYGFGELQWLHRGGNLAGSGSGDGNSHCCMARAGRQRSAAAANPAESACRQCLRAPAAAGHGCSSHCFSYSCVAAACCCSSTAERTPPCPPVLPACLQTPWAWVSTPTA